MSLQQTDILGSEPIDHEDAKHHSRVIGGDDDQYIQTLVTAARELCESHTERAIVRARYKQAFGGFASCLTLDRPPLESVEAIEYVDADGADQTLAATEYEVSTVGDPARIVLAKDKSWPAVLGTAVEPVTVTFIAGYTEAPEKIKQAVRLLVSHWYEHREAVTKGSMMTLPWAAETLLGAARWETYR